MKTKIFQKKKNIKCVNISLKYNNNQHYINKITTILKLRLF